MSIDVYDASKRVVYLQNFLTHKYSSRLKDAILRLILIFSNFESVFGEPKKFLHNNDSDTFADIDCSFADIAFEFFVERYITDGQVNGKFMLTLWKNGYQSDGIARRVERILINENPSGADRVLAVYRIAYRFRNNLLHGNEGKETHRLKDYECCFCKVNDFMLQLMKQLIQKEVSANANPNP